MADLAAPPLTAGSFERHFEALPPFAACTSAPFSDFHPSNLGTALRSRILG